MALSLLAANNAQTVLAAGISSTATSLTVNAGTGTLFPSPAAGTRFFKLTIIDAATGSLTEIVHVTARAGDVFTIQRGQEGTVPRAWSANDIAANMMTAGTLSYILGNFQPLDPTLTALAALVGVANKLPYFNGNDTATLTNLTQVGRDIIGKSSIADILTYLGLGTGNPPVGIPFFWPHTQMPNSIVDDWNQMKFLKMNGSSFTATAYPVLAKIWPGLTLPDFRGEFVRIWDDGRGVDVGRNLLTSQSFAMQNITGTLGEFTDTSGQYAIDINVATGAFQTNVYQRNVMRNNDFVLRNAAVMSTFDASRVAQTAAETRPRNVSIGFIVRAK